MSLRASAPILIRGRMEPGEGSLLVSVGKMPDLGIDEMLDNSRKNRQELGIGHRGDLLNFGMVVTDESQMRNEGPKVMPTREELGFNQHAPERTLLLDVGVDLQRHFLEVACLERRFTISSGCWLPREDSCVIGETTCSAYAAMCRQTASARS